MTGVQIVMIATIDGMKAEVEETQRETGGVEADLTLSTIHSALNKIFIFKHVSHHNSLRNTFAKGKQPEVTSRGTEETPVRTAEGRSRASTTVPLEVTRVAPPPCALTNDVVDSAAAFL